MDGHDELGFFAVHAATYIVSPAGMPPGPKPPAPAPAPAPALLSVFFSTMIACSACSTGRDERASRHQTGLRLRAGHARGLPLAAHRLLYVQNNKTGDQRRPHAAAKGELPGLAAKVQVAISASPAPPRRGKGTPASSTRLRGEHDAGDAAGVGEPRARDLGRVEHARLQQVLNAVLHLRPAKPKLALQPLLPVS